MKKYFHKRKNIASLKLIYLNIDSAVNDISSFINKSAMPRAAFPEDLFY
jgi:hypothetical protein